MTSRYHQENLLHTQKSAVGYAYYVCEFDPTQRQVENTNPAEFVPMEYKDAPIMYHTTTFAGTQQPTM